jgi:hypothetical protein
MIVNYDLKEEAVALQQAGSTVSLSSCGIPFLSCDTYNASLYIVLNKVFIQNISLFLALQSCPSLSRPNWHFAALETPCVVLQFHGKHCHHLSWQTLPNP